MKPFLQQFAEDAELSTEAELKQEYYYDKERDMLFKKDQALDLPAIELPEELGPKTKKQRRERHDD